MSLVDRIRKLRQMATALVREADELTCELGRLDEMIHGGTLPPIAVPTPEPTPTPKPIPVSTPPEPGWITGITATCWGNQEDEGRSDWDEMAYDWAPEPSHGSGKTTEGAALPARVAVGTLVYVRLAGKPETARVFPVIDVGPWNTNDPYWRTPGDRPQAESGTDRKGRTTNRAGIDLTPLSWSLLLGRPVDVCWFGSPGGPVDIRVVEPGASVHPPAVGDRIVEAMNGLPVPFPYAPETEGGTLGCADVISTALQRAGVIDRTLLSVSEIETDLRAAGWKAILAPYQNGDVMIWSPWEGSNGHQHIGIIEISGGKIWAHNNSSSQRRVVREDLSSDERPIEVVLRHP